MGARGRDRDERLRRQRDYQRSYRERLKANRVPDRDEIARELLHQAVLDNLVAGREAELERLMDEVIDGLVARGYDGNGSRRVFSDLIDRYEQGWTFQRRLHLVSPAEPGVCDVGCQECGAGG
jgi:hypothetical protein